MNRAILAALALIFAGAIAYAACDICSLTRELSANYTVKFNDTFTAISDICNNETFSSSCNWYNGGTQCCMSPTTPNPPGNAVGGAMWPTVVGSGSCSNGSYNPYSILTGGGLKINMILRAAPAGCNYSTWFSGVMQTLATSNNGGFTINPTLGTYSEIKAKLPAGTATWPAFWMLPTDSVNGKAEIDIFEEYGQELGNEICMTLHDYATPSNTVGPKCVGVPTTDFSSAYHQYGLLVDSTHTTLYFDRVPIIQVNTISKMNQTFFYLVDNGIGGGYSTVTTTSPQEMDVAYVEVWQHN